MDLLLDRIPSPIGAILLVSDRDALRVLEFADHEDRVHRALRRQYGTYTLTPGPAPGDTAQRIAAYFDGDFTALDAIPVATGGTEFQRCVWAALRRIPPSTTTSYGRLAASIGAPKAVRAVGLANGANPVALVVPCHRVIGADASLTGYGGGLERKAWLLRHEGEGLTAVARSP
jgi:methylated-DNA-[protein]-cysteine S-methyltransferase